MNALEHRIPPPLVALLMAAGMWLVSEVSPALAFSRLLQIRLAGAFAVAAAVFAVLGFRAFGRAGTTIDPVRIDRASTLVTSGVYRVTRNPMYVGLALLLWAWTFYLSAPWAAAGPLVFMVFITRFQILPEERALLSRFGELYAAYRSRVRRWL